MTNQKGAVMEIMTAAYFQSQGYYVKRGVPLTTGGGTDDVTDIDLLAINYTQPLREHRLIADCKNRERPRPYERILWTAGLAKFVGADQGIVVLPKARWQARDFAYRGGLDVLDRASIENYLSSLSKSSKFYGGASDTLTDLHKEAIAIGGAEAKALRDERRKVLQMLTVGHPITNFNRITRIAKEAFVHPSASTGVRWMKWLLLMECVSISALMILRFAAETKWTSTEDWQSYLGKKLTFGDVEAARLERIIKALSVDHTINDIPRPPYIEEVAKVVEFLINDPRAAVGFAISVDLYCFGHLGETSGESEVNPGYVGFIDEVQVLARKHLAMFSFVTGIPLPYLLSRTNYSVAITGRSDAER